MRRDSPRRPRRLAGRARRSALVLLALVPVATADLLAGCESTQDKSARLARSAPAGRSQKGLVVEHRSKRLKVVRTDVLQDPNGTAAVVELRNLSRRPLASVPIAIDVRGRGGRSLFRNDQPGLEPSLVAAPVVPAGATVTWVNDQVAADAKPRSLRVRVGDPRRRSPKRVPAIALSRPRLVGDPVSGISAEGFASNRSGTEQRKLVVSAVARRGGRIVAAGRGQINRLKPGKRARFHVFFIGDPRGASLSVAAPPTRLD